MTHPTESEATRTIGALRAAPLDEARAEGSRLTLAPGTYFSFDAAGWVDLAVERGGVELVSAEAAVAGDPGWLSLNLELGSGAFGPGDILVLVVDLEGCVEDGLSAFLRSAGAGGLADTPFADPLQGSRTRAVRTLLHQVAADDGVVGPPRFHTLVLALPRRDFRLVLHDLRFAVVPAARGIRLVPETVAAGQAGSEIPA